MAVKVALAGAGGNLGPAILNALLSAGFEVIILSRKDSSSTDSLPKHERQNIVKVDYNDVKDLTAALKGVEVVVATLSGRGLDIQKPLIDASLAAGVKRILPSEFGSDLGNPINRKLPVFQGKLKTQEYVEGIAAAHPNFTYTYVYNNAFFDWGLKVGFVLNAREHKGTLYDGGDVPLSLTTLSTIGKAVVGIIQHQEATKNRAVYVHDGVFTLNQLIELYKGIDGKEWQTENKSTKEIEKDSYDELAKPKPNVEKAFYGFIYRSAFSKDHTPDYRGKVDNKVLGIPDLSSDEVKEILKSAL